jgi:hypothetical protein
VSRSQAELVSSLPATEPVAVRQGFGLAIAAALLLLAMAAAASLLALRELDRSLADIDKRSLRQANDMVQINIEQQRAFLQSQIGVLAEDTRIRVTVMTPKFDEGTVRDVLNDLRKSANATVLAVLDVSGRVKAVSGLDVLRGVDVGTAPLISAAVAGPAVDMWTFADQLLVIGVAPIRSGQQVTALLMMGFRLTERLFTSVLATTGVFGAAFAGDRMILSSTKEPAVVEALRQGALLPEGADAVIPGGERFLARAKRTTEAPTAARWVWVAPPQLDGERIRFLRAMAWLPAVFVLLTALLMSVALRRRAQGGVP